MTLDEFLSRLEGVQRDGSEWKAVCPAHADRDPSLSVSSGDDGRLLIKCFAGCRTEDVVRAMGLQMRDLFSRPEHEPAATQRPGRSAITLEELARDKALSSEFLRSLGLHDLPGGGVGIPYMDADGRTVAVKRRTALAARKGSFWPKGKHLMAYGLERLKEARKAGFLVLVEGESDRWTLMYHGYPVLGIPGAATTRVLEAAHLEGVRCLHVVQEPGAGGQAFVRGGAGRLKEFGWKGEALAVAMPEGIKDPNDLHRRSPEGFNAAFQSALDAARPLDQAALDAVKPLDQGEKRAGTSSAADAYQVTPKGLLWLKATRDGDVAVPLTNFTAHIAADVLQDDGVEVHRVYQVEASLNGREARFALTASQFLGMNWPAERLGAGAVVYPGFGLRDHARAAIQLLSHQVEERHIFAHTGWRKLPGGWAYLHGGGAIGASGPVPDVDVALPDALAPCALPEPPDGDALKRAVRASLRMIELAGDAVALPLYCAIWRAPLQASDVAVHLAGPTGAGKSELAALAQQHWGAEFGARRLPGSWASTANSLEALAFAAKDMLLVVDDFALAGPPADVQRAHREADRLLRAQGNAAGRMRMRPDASLQPSRPPRGLILSTGEDVPRGQSLRARLLTLELPKEGQGALDWGKLSACQQEASSGLYAQAMAGYLRWLAPRYEDSSRRLAEEVARLREEAYSRHAGHRRTPNIVANLAAGLLRFLEFAQDERALDKAEAEVLWRRAWSALGEAAALQQEHQGASEPTQRFLQLLSAAVASGRAHLAGPGGSVPESAKAWGWRAAASGAVAEWEPQGRRIGWVDGEEVYLEPEAAFAEMQRLARDQDDALGLTLNTLKRRLRERGLLASTEHRGGRQRLEVRRTLEGRRREVLHLQADRLMPAEVALVAQVSQPGAAPYLGGPERGPQNGPQTPGADGGVTHESGP